MKSLQTRKVTIGSEVRCIDGRCGYLRRVVIEPIDGALTHLIVEADHPKKAPHLIPLGLVLWVEPGKPGVIQLRCTHAEFESFESARERYFLAGASGHWGYRQEQMRSWPHYRLGLGDGRADGTGVSDKRTGNAAPNAGADSYTHMRHHAHRHAGLGMVEVRRGDRMWATDGPLGRVQGLIVDRFGHHVTHVLLDEGEIWGEKRAAIPIGFIVTLSELVDGVRVDLTRDQVKGLPPVALDVQD
jgi:hypothetical protein